MTSEEPPAMERAQQTQGTASEGAGAGQREAAPRSWRAGMFHAGEVGIGKDQVKKEASSQVTKGL